jgi:A/G-specific adenine glycosylase
MPRRFKSCSFRSFFPDNGKKLRHLSEEKRGDKPRPSESAYRWFFGTSRKETTALGSAPPSQVPSWFFLLSKPSVENMSLFQQSLLNWYTKSARDLPWRKTRDPYRIWISEVMLQQTTVNTVVSYYKRWMKVFPKIGDVAKAPLARVLKMWQGLGYYQRARNIHKSARLICQSHSGLIPQDAAVLKTLPGFGPYTTNAVLSVAFGERLPIIDANVRRVCMRLLGIKGQASPEKDKRILGFLEKILPSIRISEFNQALMELGALVCRPQEPLCPSCPVKTGCRAFKKGWQDVIPAPKQKTFKNIDAVCAVIERKGKFFMQKRPDQGLLAGLWEFPGGKIEAGESPKKALLRELKEELRVSAVSAKPWINIHHAYTQFKVNLHVWRCEVTALPSQNASHRWVGPKEFKKFPMPSATARIVERIGKS